MSTPPPGNPPTPQPPPAYAQYPPQAYPPQYPPQQPYYAQPTPPPKKDNTALIVVVVVVVVVVVLALIAWYAITVIMAPVTSNSQITISGVSFAVNYPGTLQYFGGAEVTTCNQCPIHASLFSPFQFTLSLTNSDGVEHNVTDVTITGINFSLQSASPNPTPTSPVTVLAGATRNIVLSIQPTTLGGTYTLTGTIDTT